MRPDQSRKYNIGDIVAYGLHGKCVVTGIETKELSSGVVRFYQIKAIKNTIGSKGYGPNDPSILIPIEMAAANGLRPMITKEQADTVLGVLGGNEEFFEPKLTWVSKQKLLEDCIRKEGALGLAKVVAHLYVVLKRDAVPQPAVLRFYENVYRVLARELAESLNVATKMVEPTIEKALRNRLAFEQ